MSGPRRAYNFNPGPAVLPVEVLRQAGESVVEIGGSGMSILEISHRSRQYGAIQEGAQQSILRLLGLDADDYSVLFLGGGASLQFLMLPMNYLDADAVSFYIDTGSWALKALAEAQRVGDAKVLASSADCAYSRLPEVGSAPPEARYVHITTNNTIEGTQWHNIPETGPAPLVADMSSDFLSCPRDHARFALMYAGAQKNAGPAGVTVVVARNSFIEQAKDDLPPMLSYRVQHREDSLYNTPPVFGVYVVGLVCRWLEERGSLGAIEQANLRKAATIYDALGTFPDVFEPTVTEVAHRSWMNITFRLRDASREAEFLMGATERGMIGLKGHRSVGGFRASCYNALPQQAADALAAYLADFARL